MNGASDPDATTREPEEEPQADRDLVPRWVAFLDMPIWVTGPNHILRHLNKQAQAALGLTASRAVGRPCHEVIASVDAEGRPFCGPDCRLAQDCRQRSRLRPVRLRVRRPPPRGDLWIRLISIPACPENPEGGGIVHCALDDTRAHRLEEYLQKVAMRSGPHLDEAEAHQLSHLTEREREILARLADDENLRSIAARLHLSYATVRNHVQSILAKLKAHSISEAVALHLLLNGR